MEKKIIENQMKFLKPDQFYGDEPLLFNPYLKASSIDTLIFNKVYHSILGGNEILCSLFFVAHSYPSIESIKEQYDLKINAFVHEVTKFWDDDVTEIEKDIYLINYLCLPHHDYFLSKGIDDRYYYYNCCIDNLPPLLQEKLMIQKFYFLCYLIYHDKPINPFTIKAITTHILDNLFEFDHINLNLWTISNILQTNKNGLSENATFIEKKIKLQEFLMVYYMIKVKKRSKSLFFQINGLSNLPKYYHNPIRQDGIIDIVEKMFETIKNNFIEKLLSSHLDY